MKKILIFLSLLFFSISSAFAVIQTIPTVSVPTESDSGTVLFQDGGINGGFSSKISHIARTDDSHRVYYQDLVGNNLISSGINFITVTGIGNKQPTNHKVINLRNGIYLVSYDWESSSGFQSGSGVITVNTNTGVVTNSKFTAFDLVHIQSDSNDEVYIVYSNSQNSNTFIYSVSDGIKYNIGSLPGGATMSISNNSAITISDGFEFTYINFSLFHFDIASELFSQHISANSGLPLNFGPLTSGQQFISQHVQFYVDSIDLSNNTIKVTSSSFLDKVEIYEYSLDTQILTLIGEVPGEFFVGFYNQQFYSIPFTEPLLDNIKISKDEAFIGFVDVNGGVFVTVYDTVLDSWIIDEEYIPINYTSDDVFAGSLSGGAGGTGQGGCVGTGCTVNDSVSGVFDVSSCGTDPANANFFSGVSDFFSCTTAFIKSFFIGIGTFFLNFVELFDILKEIGNTDEVDIIGFFVPSANAVSVTEQILGTAGESNFHPEDDDGILGDVYRLVKYAVLFTMFLGLFFTFLFLHQK